MEIISDTDQVNDQPGDSNLNPQQTCDFVAWSEIGLFHGLTADRARCNH